MDCIEERLRDWNRLYVDLAAAQRALDDGTVVPGQPPYEQLREKVALLQFESDAALQALHEHLVVRKTAGR